ncbi:MAG: PEP-CTERM sorting domain-containing protein [Armatimonadota bacterium]
MRLTVFLALVLLAGSAAAALAADYTLPDAELVSSAQFTKDYGSSSLDGRTDVPGPGVQFKVTLATADHGKIGIGDKFPTDAAAGFAKDPVLGHDTSLAAYSRYTMTVAYLSGPIGSDIDLGLFMNTGLTGASGYPSNDTTNDTWWGGPWTTLRLGETRTLVLDFDAAEAWNIADNKAPHTGGGLHWVNGGIYTINDRDRNEVSNIGIQVADFDEDALASQVTIHLNAPAAVPEPGTMALLACGVAGVLPFARRRRRSN